MNNKKQIFSEEQLDYLKEMMNIGAGNTAAAFRQILQCEVNVTIPNIKIFPASQVSSILGDPSLPCLCGRMELLGDVSGNLFFLVPHEHKKNLEHLTELGILGHGNKSLDAETSLLIELSNIIANVYLTAVHDFCQLNLYHTIPIMANDMIQSLMDETLTNYSRKAQMVLVVENEFILEEHHIKTFFLLIPFAESVNPLLDSIDKARETIFGS